MRRAKTMFLSAGVAIALVIAATFTLQAGQVQASFGRGALPHRGAPRGGPGPTPTPTPHQCVNPYPVISAASPSPSSTQGNDELDGIVAISATNIWAVGSSDNAAQPLIEHDGGTGWSVVPSPAVGSTAPNALYGIAAVSANDIWAVGDTTPTIVGGSSPSQPLIEHWNGTAWSVTASPTIPNTYSGFSMRAVRALASNDVWAVGDGSLVEHWNGTQWSVIPDQAQGGGNLRGLAVLSDTNIWAVGTGSSSSAVNGGTFIEHYDGTSWSATTSPSPGTWFNTLTGIAAVSSTNIWAVGYWTNYEEEPYDNETLVEHWNGTSWSLVSSPDPGSLNDIFQAVGIDSTGDIWAAGQYENNSPPPDQALVEMWNGTSWTQFATDPTDPEGDADFQLNALSVISASSVWFAGWDYSNSSSEYYQTLVEHYRPAPLAFCKPT